LKDYAGGYNSRYAMVPAQDADRNGWNRYKTSSWDVPTPISP